MLEQFSEENWELVTSREKVGEMEESYPYGEKKSRKESADIVTFLSCFFSEKYWNFLRRIWNTRLEEAKQIGKGTKSGEVPTKSTLRSMRNFSSNGEVRRMIGCFVLTVLTEKKNAHEAHKEVEKGGIKNY